MEKRDVFGWIFIILGLAPLISFFFFSRWEYFFWFSNHTFIIIGLALLFKSRFWVLAQLCIGFIPELKWSVDFLSKIITGEHLWGFTSYMFTWNGFDWFHLYSLQHLLFVPAGLYALYLLKGPMKKAWLGSFAHGAVLWGVSFGFSEELNLNCVYHTCTTLNLPYYQLIWPLIMIFHILLIYFLITKGWKKKKRKKYPGKR